MWCSVVRSIWVSVEGRKERLESSGGVMVVVVVAGEESIVSVFACAIVCP